MKPLITTVRALRELATGLSPEAVDSSPILFEVELPNAVYLISAEDQPDAQRVVLMREKNQRELYVPEHLHAQRREVLSRMASFVERARQLPLSLPRGWSQYKHDNFLAFFAVPGRDDSTRWVAELLPGDPPDVVLWTTTTSANKATL